MSWDNNNHNANDQWNSGNQSYGVSNDTGRESGGNQDVGASASNGPGWDTSTNNYENPGNGWDSSTINNANDKRNRNFNERGTTDYGAPSGQSIHVEVTDPYPIVFVHGPHGTGKSSFCDMLQTKGPNYGFERINLSDLPGLTGRNPFDDTPASIITTAVIEAISDAGKRKRPFHSTQKKNKGAKETETIPQRFLINGFPENREQWSGFKAKCAELGLWEPINGSFSITLDCARKTRNVRLEDKNRTWADAHRKWDQERGELLIEMRKNKEEGCYWWQQLMDKDDWEVEDLQDEQGLSEKEAFERHDREVTEEAVEAMMKNEHWVAWTEAFGMY